MALFDKNLNPLHFNQLLGMAVFTVSETQREEFKKTMKASVVQLAPSLRLVVEQKDQLKVKAHLSLAQFKSQPNGPVDKIAKIEKLIEKLDQLEGQLKHLKTNLIDLYR